MSLVQVNGVSVQFGDQVILSGIDLSVEPGEVMAVMGSSGGGKTTLLRAISGLVVPSAGTVVVAGINVQKDPDGARKQMGMVFQSAALFDYLSVRENIAFGLKRWTKDTPEVLNQKIDAVLELMNLSNDGDKLPGELSGGMKKRVGIARALVLNPKVMLYDEPTTGLDPITTYTIDSLIADLRQRTGITSLVVSHDVNSVMRTADRVAFLSKGQIHFLGSPAEFIQSTHPDIRELVRKSQAQSFA